MAVTDAPAADTAAPPKRRLSLLAVAAVVLALDIVTKVLAVRCLTLGPNGLDHRRHRASGPWCVTPARPSRWRPATPGC